MIDLLPSRMNRAFGSELAYSEASSSVHKFNSRFLRERRVRLRLPFVDSQTHIIQSPTQNQLWKQATQRLPPTRDDHVASYARPTWRKKRVHLPPSSSASAANGMSKETNGQSSDGSAMKEKENDGERSSTSVEDPRMMLRAGELGKRCNALSTSSICILQVSPILICT
jgi:hypothetical protein